MRLEPVPSTSPSSACRPDDKVCQQIYNWVGDNWLTDGGYYLVVQPVRILLILLFAMIVRALLNHSINKIVERTAAGRVPAFLRPLREKMPAPAPGLVPERRRQRAEAIGSVLKSVVTVIVFSIAFLMVLDLFGFNLAPLLTSLGIAGVALGFGAQTLVKDMIAGLFMLLEDQYGVGDVIDTGEAIGVVESVGLRTVTLRDARGVLWYVRNGEIIRIGNKSQGWAQLLIDVPIGFASVEEASVVLRQAIDTYAADPVHANDFIEPPYLAGVEQITIDGTIMRVICKTPSERQIDVQRELRLRLTEALNSSGITAQMQAGRVIRPSSPDESPRQP
ncbi:mechanosensitive ion channel family protein [Catelliglobosispora koreensis]|uniref:mechanosensitive ion channel family protein n=1 Tax=Catelliglobosispora koreensis TaxID=129052 RepID=UPI00037391E5|nr:mechanosensitive ion channel family protein [Catelliglobosispora koreensis]